MLNSIVDFCIKFESGDDLSDDEIIEGFQYMINSGVVWELQGSYGRMAESLINSGYCKYPEKIVNK